MKPNQQGEQWLPAVGFQGQYSISNLGRVWSELREIVRKPSISKDGYPRISLRDATGKLRCIEIHRLVAKAFLPNPDDLPTVNHIDGNKLNNTVANLEWASHQENIQHAYSTGLNQPKTGAAHATSKRVAQLGERGQVVALFASIREAANAIGVDAAMVSNVCNGKCRATKGVAFAFAGKGAATA